MATATSKTASTPEPSALFPGLEDLKEFEAVKEAGMKAGMKAVKILRKMGEGDRFLIAGIDNGDPKAARAAFVGRVLDTEGGGFAGGRILSVQGGEILASKDMGAAVLHLRKQGKTFTILAAQRLKKSKYKEAAKKAKDAGFLLGGKPEKKDKKKDKKSKKPAAAAAARGK